MSLGSWREEFYPVRADDCPRDQALEHSILKWTGLLPENLKKHEVVKCDNYLENFTGHDWLRIDRASCALCQYYYHETGGCRHKTDPCPIVHVTKMTCDACYKEFVRYDQVTPMLNLLLRVKEALDAPQA